MIDRRHVLKTGLATLAAPAVATAQTPKATIALMAYAGIFQDNYTKAVVEPFEKAFPGIKVNFVSSGTSAQMLGSVRAAKADPQADVVIMDVTTSTIGNAEGLFEKMPVDKVPSLAELFPEARLAGEYGPAVTYDHLVLSHDASIAPLLTKLADLWRPELQGQIALSAPPNILGLGLTAMVEKMEGGDHTKSIDKAIAKLKALAPSVKTFDPNPDGYSLILNGVAKVATGWNARAQLYSDQSQGKLATLLPPEGSVFQINTINITAGSKNRDAAFAFVSFALSQAAQKAFTERMFYAPVNAKAQIDPKAIARTASAPDSRSRMIAVDWVEIVKVRDQWNNRWRREIIAAAR